MNLEAHYSKLYNESINNISSGNYEIDDLIDSSLDKRFGITLLLRPSIEVKNEIQKFINQLKKVEPHQYYYPSSDIHITIMSIISCYDGFDISKIDLSKYTELIKNCLIKNKNITIQFKGLTASNSCIMLQGFMNDTTINDIREKLRTAFKNSDLEQSLDKRYAIQTAHSTIVRFRKKLENTNEFLKTVDQFKNHDFGSFQVKEFELVFNDWYQREENTKLLETFLM
ncbi:mutarotase [Gaetbulibacter sp. M235]|uniref:2'-5' RNA ligase family protein n=1 Tax=Gaetbulibacter sp. M235 TaxID=3126510 RepID=UPI00374EAC72